MLEIKVDQMVDSPRSNFDSNFESPRPLSTAEPSPRDPRKGKGKSKGKRKGGKNRKPKTAQPLAEQPPSDQIEVIAQPRPVLVEDEKGDLVQV